MKTIKKAGVIILAVIMIMGLNLTTVLAETDASGRDPDKDVSFTIYKYEYDKNLTFPTSDGTKLEASAIPSGAKPVPGVTFKIEKVTLKSGASATPNVPNDYEPVTGDDAFSTTGTTGSDGKVVFSTDDVAKTDSNADVLPGQGIYKITEVKSATAGTAAIADFIVSLPMANPSTEDEADPWLYDVYAYPKNDVQSTIDKEVVESGTEGNIVIWKYSLIIPKDIETPLTGNENLVITDKLDYRLKYVVDSVIGKYTDKDGTEGAFTLSTDDGTTGDYVLTKTSSTDDGGKTIEVLEISITPAGFAKLAAAFTGDGTGTPMLYFTFGTRTNIGSEISDLGEIYNGGELNYTNSAGHEYDNEKIGDPDKPKTDVYGIKIYKINVNSEVLKDAKFNIYTSEADAIAGDTSKALKMPDGSGIWEVTTNEYGYAYIYGLAEGTYYLVETAPPTGYNILTEPIEVVITTGTDSEDATVAADLTVQVNVTNKKGFDLPTTGGMGTILFTAAGLALIGTAVTILIFAKRKKAEKSMDA